MDIKKLKKYEYNFKNYEYNFKNYEYTPGALLKKLRVHPWGSNSIGPETKAQGMEAVFKKMMEAQAEQQQQQQKAMMAMIAKMMSPVKKEPTPYHSSPAKNRSAKTRKHKNRTPRSANLRRCCAHIIMDNICLRHTVNLRFGPFVR